MSTNTRPDTRGARRTSADNVSRPNAAAAAPRAPRWGVPGSLLTATAGLGVSIYLTVAHYTATVTLACPQTATVNCEKVTTSPQSQFLGMPVAVLGVAYFAVMLALCSPPAWRHPAAAVRWVRVLGALCGVGFVAWLVYAELFVIDAICLWCTSVHALTLVLFSVIALATAADVQGTDTGARQPPR
jgi:uncharacterized membrane protein